MKKLLSALIFLYSSAYACGVGSHAEIDSCTLDDKFSEVFTRLYPSHIEISEAAYVSDSSGDVYAFTVVSGSFYDRLLMDPKPAQAGFNAELAVLKQELKDDFDFRVSVDSLDRMERRKEKCGYNIPNSGKLKRDIKAAKDTVKRDCLASKTAELDAEDVTQATQVQLMQDLAFGKSIQIEFIVYIRGTGQDDPRAERLMDKLAGVLQAIQAGNIRIARTRLQGLTADSDLPQATIDSYAAKMATYLGI